MHIYMTDIRKVIFYEGLSLKDSPLFFTLVTGGAFFGFISFIVSVG
jgi:hypothetical protein